VNACADSNPEHNENASEADQAKGNATGFEANLQHSRYEGVDGEKEGDQTDSEFTSLLNKALYCAIWPCRDDPVVSPPDAKDTANCLQKVEYEKREHIDVSRLLKQLPSTVWERLLIPMYVPANPDNYDDDTNATKGRCCNRKL